jgi:exopolysaccharide production protein ExoQ
MLPEDKKQPAFTLDFFLCFVSFLSLMLNTVLGMWAIIGFMTPWLIVFIRKSSAAHRGAVANWPLLLFPTLAALSTVWSDDPSWTMKASVELFATVAIGIMAGCCVRPRSLIAALLMALLTVAVLSVLTMWDALVSYSTDEYINGIFGSKNAFASVLSLLFLTAAAIVMDKKQAGVFRGFAYASLVGTPALLYAAHSLGAILAVILTMLVLGLAQILKRMPRSLRPLAYIFIALVLLAAALPSLLMENSTAEILKFFGKDASLTGRTFLWDNAWQYISERPILGTGFGAFWRVDNPRAQVLWYALHVPAGPGFNFHNEYLELLVELGIVGCALGVGYLLVIARRAFTAMLQSPTAEQKFAFIVMAFTLIRTPVEVAIFGQFGMSMVLLCAFWIYLKSSSQIIPATIGRIYAP